MCFSHALIDKNTLKYTLSRCFYCTSVQLQFPSSPVDRNIPVHHEVTVCTVCNVTQCVCIVCCSTQGVYLLYVGSTACTLCVCSIVCVTDSLCVLPLQCEQWLQTHTSNPAPSTAPPRERASERCFTKRYD